MGLNSSHQPYKLLSLARLRTLEFKGTSESDYRDGHFNCYDWLRTHVVDGDLSTDGVGWGRMLARGSKVGEG